MLKVVSQGTHVPVADVVNGVATVKSTNIAEVFEKRHDHVLRDIENILTSLSSTAFDMAPKLVLRVDSQSAKAHTGHLAEERLNQP